LKWKIEKHADEWWIRLKYNMLQLRKTEMEVVEIEDLLYAGPNKKIKDKIVKLFEELYGEEVKE